MLQWYLQNFSGLSIQSLLNTTGSVRWFHTIHDRNGCGDSGLCVGPVECTQLYRRTDKSVRSYKCPVEYEIPRFAGVCSDKLPSKNEDISGIRLGRRATIIFNITKTTTDLPFGGCQSAFGPVSLAPRWSLNPPEGRSAKRSDEFYGVWKSSVIDTYEVVGSFGTFSTECKLSSMTNLHALLCWSVEET